MNLYGKIRITVLLSFGLMFGFVWLFDALGIDIFSLPVVWHFPALMVLLVAAGYIVTNVLRRIGWLP